MPEHPLLIAIMSLVIIAALGIALYEPIGDLKEIAESNSENAVVSWISYVEERNYFITTSMVYLSLFFIAAFGIYTTYKLIKEREEIGL